MTGQSPPMPSSTYSAPAAGGPKALTRELLALLTPEERETLGRPSVAHTLFTFGHIWLGLVVAFLAIGPVVSWPWVASVPASALLVLYIGSRLNALAVQVHEAAHHLLMRSHRANDLFCNLFGAYWVLNDVDSYRRVHHQHHIHLHDDDDPDLDLYRLPGGGGWAGVVVLLESLLAISSVRRIAMYVRTGKSAPRPGLAWVRAGHLVAKLLAQFVVLSAFVAMFDLVRGITYFFVYWVVPLFCVMPTIIRVRIVAEHFAPELNEPHTGLFVSRTTVSNALDSYFIGAEMQYHFEHHLIPSVPHHRLARLHQLLEERGYFDRPRNERDRCLSGGYMHYWYRLLRGRTALQRVST